MAQIKPRSEKNFIDRLNDQLDPWLEQHLPPWLYKQVTFQPDRPLRSSDPKAARNMALLLALVAFIALIISLQ